MTDASAGAPYTAIYITGINMWSFLNNREVLGRRAGEAKPLIR